MYLFFLSFQKSEGKCRWKCGLFVQSAGKVHSSVTMNVALPKVSELPNRTQQVLILWEKLFTPGFYTRLPVYKLSIAVYSSKIMCPSQPAPKVSACLHYDVLKTKPIWMLMLKCPPENQPPWRDDMMTISTQGSRLFSSSGNAASASRKPISTGFSPPLVSWLHWGQIYHDVFSRFYCG